MKIIRLMLFSCVIAFALISSAFALEKSIRDRPAGGPMLMPMRVWVLPEGAGTIRSGYYEYFTVEMNESDLTKEIEAPKYTPAFPAGPEAPKIKSKGYEEFK